MGACGRLHRWSGHPNGGPTQAIAPRDGHIAIAVPTMRPARACRSGETCRGCHAAVRTLCHARMSALSLCRHGLPVQAAPPPPAEHVTGCCRGGRGGRPPGRAGTRPGGALAQNLHSVGPASGLHRRWRRHRAGRVPQRPGSPGWCHVRKTSQAVPVPAQGEADGLQGGSPSVPGDPAQGQQQMVAVLQNLAIMGGLLRLFADGAGAFALDAAWPKGSVTTDTTGTLVRS
jgi:hypothetical protein